MLAPKPRIYLPPYCLLPSFQPPSHYPNLSKLSLPALLLPNTSTTKTANFAPILVRETFNLL